VCSTAAIEAALKAFGAPIEWEVDPYGRAAARVYDELLRLASLIASGRLALEDVEPRMQELLERGHIASHLAGQQMSGYNPSETLAMRRGRQVAQAQNSYVRGLVTALVNRDPRYWDIETETWREDRLASRIGSYVGRTRGTAYDGWVSAAPAFTLYDWRLGAVEMHCEACPVIASAGPYLDSEDTGQLEYATLFTKPGELDTPCLFNCTCTLSRVSDGATGPLPFRFAA
jgi:hypothetical protein